MTFKELEKTLYKAYKAGDFPSYDDMGHISCYYEGVKGHCAVGVFLDCNTVEVELENGSSIDKLWEEAEADDDTDECNRAKAIIEMLPELPVRDAKQFWTELQACHDSYSKANYDEKSDTTYYRRFMWSDFAESLHEVFHDNS